MQYEQYQNTGNFSAGASGSLEGESKRETQVQREMNNLRMKVDAVTIAFSALQKRLVPVLRNDVVDGKNTDDAPVEILSPLPNAVREESNRLESLVRTIQTTTSVLEI